MRKNVKRIVLLACLCFLSSMLWFPGQATAKEEILIGAHLPLSGPGAGFGLEQKWAYEQAVKDINAGGGIFVKEYNKKLPVRLVLMDDETNPRKAATVVAQLIKQKKVDLLLSGQNGAWGVLPGMVTAEKFKTYYHGSVIWVPDFLKHNFQWSTMYFVDIAQIATIGYEVWNSLPEAQRPEKPALFMEDTSDGKQMGMGLVALGKKYGYDIAQQETIGTGAKDFSRQIAKAKAKGVDAILCMANVTETATMIRQMKQMNFDVKFFQGWKGTWSNKFLQTMGKDAEGVLCDGHWSMDYPFPGAKELGERYYNEHKEYSVGAGMYYALCQSLWQAIEKAGTLDGAHVRQAVLKNRFETVNGNVEYNEKGVALYPAANFQWRNGKQTVIYPFDLAPAKAEPMLAWNRK